MEEDAAAEASRTSYRPGWRFSGQAMPDGSVSLLVESPPWPDVSDPAAPPVRLGVSRLLHPSWPMDRSSVRRTVRSMVHELERHEADEWLSWGGERPFDPHGPAGPVP